MSELFEHLLARGRGEAESVRPRAPSPFADAVNALLADPDEDDDSRLEVEVPADRARADVPASAAVPAVSEIPAAIVPMAGVDSPTMSAPSDMTGETASGKPPSPLAATLAGAVSSFGGAPEAQTPAADVPATEPLVAESIGAVEPRADTPAVEPRADTPAVTVPATAPSEAPSEVPATSVTQEAEVPATSVTEVPASSEPPPPVPRLDALPARVSGPIDGDASPVSPARAAEAAPRIEVRIGRVYVRAVTEAPAPKKTVRPRRAAVAVSLHDYLAHRRGG
ncbi:MAG: hypothetical protein GY719_23035 [bacterium]|nr:hypothetical protein [bacterium]